MTTTATGIGRETVIVTATVTATVIAGIVIGTATATETGTGQQETRVSSSSSFFDMIF